MDDDVLGLGTNKYGEARRTVEKRFIDAFALSRPHVSKELKKLEDEGWLQFPDSHEATVSQDSLDDIKEIYEIREALEGLASRLFATTASGDLIQELENAVNAFDETAHKFQKDPKNPENQESLFAAKEDVYNILFNECGNGRLSDSLASLRSKISNLRKQTLTYPGRSVLTARELRAILDAIKRHNPEEAEKASISHVREAYKVAFASYRKKHARDTKP